MSSRERKLLFSGTQCHVHIDRWTSTQQILIQWQWLVCSFGMRYADRHIAMHTRMPVFRSILLDTWLALTAVGFSEMLLTIYQTKCCRMVWGSRDYRRLYREDIGLRRLGGPSVLSRDGNEKGHLSFHSFPLLLSVLIYLFFSHQPRSIRITFSASVPAVVLLCVILLILLCLLHLISSHPLLLFSLFFSF
jgi:hypothetical protein